MPEPGAVYASVDDRRECLVVGVTWGRTDGSMAALPRVEYVERNGSAYCFCIDRPDVFAKTWEYCSIVRPASLEPRL